MKRVYIAAADGIHLYEMDGDGKLSFVDRTPCGKTTYLCEDAGRIFALLLTLTAGDNTGAVVPYFPDPQGLLIDPCPALLTGGACGCHLSVLDNVVYVANYDSGSVARIPLDGSPVTVVDHARQGIPCGPDGTRQEMPHPHQIVPSPDGKYLCAVDLGLDAVLTYDRELRLETISHLPAGCGPRHLVFSPDGKFAYCANELADTVSVLRYDKERGGFTHLSQILAHASPFTKEEYESRPARNYPAAIRLDAKGDRLLVSNRGCDTVAVFRRDDNGAVPTWFAEFPVLGQKESDAWPRDFAVSDDFLICANEHADCVTVLRMNEAKTAASVVCEVPDIPQPSAVLVL
ncbi:MAG: lactonase family protein [Clostridia bacterium]|nr:lactonase family protein [Clostridia bacterium]